MRYFLYLVLLYIGLIFNYAFDIISIISFFIILNEDEKFALIFSFFAGLFFDLYYPTSLGVQALIFTILAQSLLYLKKFFIYAVPSIIASFIVFFLLKLIVVNLVLSSPINGVYIVLTILIFLPLFLILNKVNFGLWMRTY